MHDRSEWMKCAAGPVTIKDRSYANLVQFKRPCATCGEAFSIYVTPRIANGHADSNSFALKNCEKHRRNKSGADVAEVETLRTYKATTLEELNSLYTRNNELQAENAALRARLAQYELPEALRTQAGVVTGRMTFPDASFVEREPIGCEPVQNTTNSPVANRWPWE